MNARKYLLALCFAITGQAFAQANPVAVIDTSMGEIKVELLPAQAPLSVANFIEYAEDGFYDGTVFHRVISHFMIQGGGFTEDMQKKPTRDPIKNEADNGLSNQRGTIAMARTNDPHSATAQFFINVQDNMNLDHRGTANSRSWGYTVFGRVVEGLNVVDDIRFVETATRPPFADVPTETVLINSIKIID